MILDLQEAPGLLAEARLLTSTLRLDAAPGAISSALAAARGVDWPRLLRHADAHTLTPLLYSA